MKKIIVLLLVSFTTVAQNVTPKEVIENYLQAIGGKAAIEAITDLTMSLKGDVQGQQIETIIKRKAPNKTMTIVTVDGMGEVNKTVFDGEKGYIVGMGNKQALDSAAVIALKRQSGLVSEMSYLSMLDSFQYLGKETIQGTECHAIKYKNGSTESTEYYAIDSGLKLQQKVLSQSAMGELTLVTNFKNYKDVNGVKFPFRMEQDMGMVIISLEVTDMKVNSGLPDTDFQ